MIALFTVTTQEVVRDYKKADMAAKCIKVQGRERARERAREKREARTCGGLFGGS